MAQHFYGPPQDFTGSYIVPSSTTGYASSALPPADSSRLSTPPIKEEYNSTNSNHQVVETKQTGRSNKRQKTEDGESSHRFVSQKKWKFSEGQPWLPSRLSSKAQNASKASYDSKVEPAISKVPSFSKASATAFTTNTGPDSSLSFQTSTSTNPQISKTGQTSLKHSRLRLPSDSASKAAADLPQALPTRSPLLQSFVPRPKSPTDSIESDLAPKKRGKRSKNTNESVVTLPIGSSRLPLGKSRSARGLQTLSLEKDAERISALIAEKKKENESNMFRERLLKRQQKHKDQKQPSDENEDDAALRDTTTSQSPSFSQVVFDSDVRSPSAVIDLSSSTDKNRLSHSPTRDLSSVVPDRLQRPMTQGRIANNRFNGRNISSEPQVPVTNTPSSLQKLKLPRDKQQLNTQQEILFGSGVAAPLATASQQSRSTNPTKNNHRTEPPPKGSAPFEVEDADLTAQLVAFTNQLIPKDSTQRLRTGHTPSDQGPSQHYYPKQVLTSLSMPRTHAPFGTSPNPHSTGFDMMERASISLPSSAHPSYSHSPTNPSITHFSHMDISSSQQHQSAMMYNPNPMRSRPASVGPVSAGPAYHGIHQQMWIPPDQHDDQSSMSRMSTQMVPISRQDGAGMMPGPTTKVPPQRRQSHQDVPASNTNMFNGNERTNAGGGPNPAPSKPRVNMFSDTKGTPFPMHDIIRQIEMT